MNPPPSVDKLANRLVAGFYTLSGAPVRQPSRFTWGERVHSAARAGYRGLGLTRIDYLAMRSSGVLAQELNSVCQDVGIAVTEIEMLYDWYRNGKRSLASQANELTLYEMADALHPQTLMVGVADAADDLPDLETLGQRFGELCDRAADHGLKVALEFQAGCGIDSPNAALQIVEAADRANGGLLLDSWHLYRAGHHPVDLTAIPFESIFGLQLADAHHQVVGTLFEDTTTRRLAPGDGELDLGSFLETVLHRDPGCLISVEIISTDWQQLDVVEAAKLSYERATQVFNQLIGTP